MCNNCGYQNTKELCLALTNICNEKCPYCVRNINNIKTSYQKKFDINKISLLDKFNDISDSTFYEISIMGGEPGIVSYSDINILFKYLKNRNVKDDNILILTNGKFFDNFENIYPNYRYAYHVISSSKFNNYNSLNLKIEYLYVVHTIESILDLNILLINNPNTIFRVIIDKYKKNIDDDFFKNFVRLFLDNKNIKINPVENDIINSLIPKIFNSSQHLNIYHQISRKACRDIMINIDLY